MGSDGKLHIPSRKRPLVSGQQVVKVSEEAYNVLVDIYNESSLSLKGVASMMILFAADKVVYDKEDLQ